MIAKVPADVVAAKETFWRNPDWLPFGAAQLKQTADGIADAAARLRRFAPFIAQAFPETAEQGGLIESPLRELPALRDALALRAPVPAGRLFLKMDSHLAIAGSVKARGGIYEVLKHTEDIALAEGILRETDDYRCLADHRELFAGYTVQVGSTGNLGLSIGIASAQIGFRVIVHMSADARQWKKDLLRSRGVEVREYDGDYGKAVEQGRALSDADPRSYFVDDEHSETLFYGYAVAGQRLAEQLAAQNVAVDREHPLIVTIPCGVGGAPGGVTFGLKQIFGDNVHCFFVEPTQCPCMLLGMSSGEGDRLCVQDIGLTGQTEADGLAVGRASGLVAASMAPLLSGIFTVADAPLFDALRLLHETEGIFIEPSSCAALAGFTGLTRYQAAQEYLDDHGLTGKPATHVLWATGGSLVPEEIRRTYLHKFEKKEL
ncbi:MAG: D-serine ammonia-lyase [Oscillospiraceae bacterium]